MKVAAVFMVFSSVCLTVCLHMLCLLTAPMQCANDEFGCDDHLNNTMCIPLSWQCDGSADCDDQSDEAGCHVNRCGANHFACVAGDECIHEAWICDGDFDCDDGSDERNCKSPIT